MYIGVLLTVTIIYIYFKRWATLAGDVYPR